MQLTVHFVNGEKQVFDLPEEELNKFFTDRNQFFSNKQKVGGQYSKADGGIIDFTFENIMWIETHDSEKGNSRQNAGGAVSKSRLPRYRPI